MKKSFYIEIQTPFQDLSKEQRVCPPIVSIGLTFKSAGGWVRPSEEATIVAELQYEAGCCFTWKVYRHGPIGYAEKKDLAPG